MNIGNLLAGITVLIIGLLLDIIVLIFNKKIKSPWIVLGATILCDIIAFVLWYRSFLLPHCLGCMIDNVGYVFDSNDIKTYTIIINSVLGLILLSNKYKMRKGFIAEICQLLGVIVICILGFFALSVMYG